MGGEVPDGYTDDGGEIVGELRPVPDFLPSPEALVLRGDTVKVTLALSCRSVEFLKREADRKREPYHWWFASLPLSHSAGYWRRRSTVTCA